MHSFPLTVPPDVAFASIQFLCFRYFFFILTSQHSVLLTAPENRRNKTGCIKTMPGPKMGPRPNDFDEDLVRQAPTFQRWQKMLVGQKLRYACRDFVKGHGDDEERLMRRIMIARRNNLRDHAIRYFVFALETFPHVLACAVIFVFWPMRLLAAAAAVPRPATAAAVLTCRPL